MRQFVWAKEDRFVVVLSTDRERRDCPERDDGVKEEPHGFAGAFTRAPNHGAPT